MAKLVSKSFTWDVETIDGVAGFNVYYTKTPPVTYETSMVKIPTSAGVLSYGVTLPASIPEIGEGQYQLGVASYDAAGNISDIATLDYFFDFTPPAKPKNLKVS